MTMTRWRRGERRRTYGVEKPELIVMCSSSTVGALAGEGRAASCTVKRRRARVIGDARRDCGCLF